VPARIRRWRWRHSERQQIEDLRGYRTPIQVCPRGCEHHELARRDVMARSRLSGRAALHVAFNFETTNCPQCGSRLVRDCARCHQQIFAPIVDRCQSCGLPQPWATERRAGADRASIRLWRPDQDGVSHEGRRAHDPAVPLYSASDGGDLWVIEGDIVRLAVDAVVSDDDVDGQMWAQVARAIKAAAGEGVERLAQEGKPFKLGHAWWTSPGALQQMRGIIHVASMSRHGESELKTVRQCLSAAFELAASRGYESLGVAAIGSGPASIPLDEWFQAFAEVAVNHLHNTTYLAGSEDAAPPLSIVLVLFEPPSFEGDLSLLQRSVWDAWIQAGRPASGKPAASFNHRRRWIRKSEAG
jgi:O-acetyl-ADP-ribose deacetylase (regulator of RNase III)/predicted RNA-binding Zn-ribbon protein involved in translation (DUF1610 family)